MAIVISKKIADKLWQKHSVRPEEVEQCFANISGKFLLDTREEHKSNPPTKWFIAPTNFGKLLKIAFIFEDGNVYIRSAFAPNDAELRMYKMDGEGN